MTGSNITTALLAGTELYRPPGVHKTSPLLDYYAFGVGKTLVNRDISCVSKSGNNPNNTYPF